MEEILTEGKKAVVADPQKETLIRAPWRLSRTALLANYIIARSLDIILQLFTKWIDRGIRIVLYCSIHILSIHFLITRTIISLIN